MSQFENINMVHPYPFWRNNDESDQGLELNFDLSERFLSDMLKMIREGSYNDVCIKLHDGEIKANKSILAARCDYFDATFRWKDNNNQDVEEIVINDCSKKVMTRIIEYIFTGVLKAKDLNLLEFLELKDQVRKMFPGDELEVQFEAILKDETNHNYLPSTSLDSLPTYDDVVKALSRVETGNLQSEVMAEFAREIEKSHSDIIITRDTGNQEENEKAIALSNLLSLGVIETVKHLRLHPENLRSLPGNHLQTLVSCVTESISIGKATNQDMAILLDNIQCKELYLVKQTLNQEETEALVRAMTSRVEILRLDFSNEWDMDYDTFSKYKGDGKCRELHIIDCPDSVQILDSVNCKELHLFTQSNGLSKDETEALVRAMTSRVEIVHLGGGVYTDTFGFENSVTLDIETLQKYKGDGKCREVHCNSVLYRPTPGDFEYFKWLDEESAETWAEQMNWDIEVKIQNGEFLLSRKKKV